jgi:hypothetical protein
MRWDAPWVKHAKHAHRCAEARPIHVARRLALQLVEVLMLDNDTPVAQPPQLPALVPTATTPCAAGPRPALPQLDEHPSWTAHEDGAAKFDHTVLLTGQRMRELGHVDRRGVRRVGVRIVEIDAGYPVLLERFPPMPRHFAAA